MTTDSHPTAGRSGAPRPIIDTHLDLAWNALGWGRDLTRSVDELNDQEAGMTRPGAANKIQRPFVRTEKPAAAQSQAAIESRIYAPAPQSARMKIIGGRFDAYA